MFSFCVFPFFGLQPKFRTGLLVRHLDPEYPDMRHVLIKERRFIRSNEGGRKRWVYDGVMVKADGTEIVYSCTIIGASENSLDFIAGIT